MVAIKIQSKEDIIAAYLTSLGFNPQQLPEIVPAVAAELDFRNGNGDELVKKIDAFLLRLARRTFSFVWRLIDGWSLQVRETVDGETPAKAATSLIVTAIKIPLSSV